MFILHSLCTYPMFFAARFTRTRSALNLIVFLESKVVKSMFSTPTCGRPTREPRPNVHIWPRSALQKGSKSAFFNGEVESRLTASRCPIFGVSLSQHATRRLSGHAAGRPYTFRLIKLRHVLFEPHSNSHRGMSRKVAQCGLKPQLRMSARRVSSDTAPSRSCAYRRDDSPMLRWS